MTATSNLLHADYTWQCSTTMRIVEDSMQREQQESKDTQFHIQSTNLEAILSVKLPNDVCFRQLQ
jgi:hypothetical protein